MTLNQEIQAKFPNLEISEILLSDVLKDNQNLRFDAEYFKKVYLHFFKDVPNLQPLGNFVAEGYRVVYETTEIINSEEGNEKDYPIFLQATDLQTPFIKTDRLYYVHEKDWLRYPKGRITKGEILIEVKGKVEKVAIVPDDFPEKVLVTGSLYKMTVNNKINKHYLLTYLICKYGNVFKERYKTNLLISFLSKDDLYKIPVPVFSVNFQNQIENLYNKIFLFQKQSQNLYTSAENLLLSALGLNNFESKKIETNYNIKSFKDSFLTSGRLDAEYWQPKYEIVENLVKSQGYSLVEDICSEVNYGTVPTSLYSEDGLGIPYIKGMNLKQCSIVGELDKITNTSELNKRFYTKEGDIIISQMGTVGDVGVVSKEQENWLFASFTIRIRLKDFSKFKPHFVGLYIQKVAKEYYLLRNIAQASVRQNTDLPTIRNMYIPHIDLDLQNKISLQVQESFVLRAESERLLALAKKAVELAIEEGETEAEKLLL